MNIVSRDEITKEVAKELHVSQKQVHEIMTSYFDAIYVHLCQGESVSIPRFGKYEITTRGPRVARNPQNGEPVEVPARHGLKFKPTSTLKENISNIPV